MSNHNRVGAWWRAGLVFLLVAVSFLQILLLIQADRIHQQLSRLGRLWEAAPRSGREPNANSVVAAVVPAAPAAPSAAAETQEPVSPQRAVDEGDWLVWALRVEPRTLNPLSAEADIYTRWIVVPFIFEPLLSYDYDRMELRPALAKAYEVGNDGRQITFHLREDARFSDDTPVTADDVIFTFQTIVNPRVDAANIAGQYENVVGLAKLNDLTVRFFLAKPDSRSLELLSFCRTAGIFPKHIYGGSSPEEFNRRVSDPVGSGPYVFEAWQTGDRVILRRNEDYWGPKPALKKLVFRFIPNSTAAVQALRQHEVDIIVPEPEQYANLAEDAAFGEEFHGLRYWTPWTPYTYIGWNCDSPLFADPRVRLAMTHLIDRGGIVEYLLAGLGAQISGPFYAYGPDGDPDIQPWPHDPNLAMGLLAEAGWSDSDGDGVLDKDGTPFEFRFLYPASYILYEQLARLLTDEARRVGILVQPESLEWSILSDRLKNRNFDAYVASWSPESTGDVYLLFHSSQIADGCNYVGFWNEQADAILERARGMMDSAKRAVLYRQLHGVLHREQPYTFLFTRPTLWFVDRRFENVVIHPNGLNYLEWYVPKESQRH